MTTGRNPPSSSSPSCCTSRVTATALMVALSSLLLLAGPGGAQAAAAPLAPKRITGKLVRKEGHVVQLWTLVTSSGDVYKLPQQPLDTASGMPLPAGCTAGLWCTPAAASDPNNCTTISSGSIVKASAPVKTTELSLRLLVMVLSLSGSCSRAGAQVATVQQAYSSPAGHANFLRNCSYGKVVLETVTVIGTPVACSTAIVNRCDEDAMALAARSSATSQFGSGYLNGFTHFSYVLPTGLTNSCGWVGLAELPGTQTWYTPDTQGVFSKGTVMQEAVHNLNIYHGWKDGVEYADYSTSMGSGDSCPSSPELWRLGWASLLAQLNTTSFPAKAFRSYTLPATYLGPDKAMIKIQPDWLGGAYSKNVYLALRVKAGGDKDLEAQFNQKVNIHEVNKAIDNNFFASGDPRVSIIGTLGASGSTDLTTYKILVRAEALVESGTKMTIKLCRYDASSTECKDSTNAAPPLPPPTVVRQPPPSPPVKSPPQPKQSPPPQLPPPPPPSPAPVKSPPPTGRSPPPTGRRSPPPLRKRSPPPPSPPPPSPPDAPPPVEDYPPPQTDDYPPPPDAPPPDEYSAPPPS